MTALKISQIKPLAGYALVEPAEAETKTASGIILPGAEGEKPQYGTVLAVGEGCSCGDGCGCGTGGCGCGGNCGCGNHEHGEKKEKHGECSCEAPVEIGDMVIYKEWGGNKVEINDKEYQFLKFEDILAVVTKK